MTTQATPLRATTRTGSRRLAPPSGSWADTLWTRLTATPQAARRTELILVGILTLIAAIIRFVRLDQPHRLVFDEVYYVMDGWTLVNVGYEADFPNELAREAFANGDVNSYDANQPSYVVHPPFGKLLIGWGMQLFGAEHIFAWRVAVAFFGTLAVPLLYLVGRKLFGSIALGAIAAGFLALDGHAIVTSRIAILDGLLMFFVLLGFLFLLYDREQHARQLRAWNTAWRRDAHRRDPNIPLEAVPSKWSLTIGRRGQAPATGPVFGPVLWKRPWLLAMAVSLGLATGVKWSGAVFLAALCVAVVALDAAARKQVGITYWLSGAILKQAPITFLLTVPIAFATYLATWTGWLSTEGGYYRDWAERDPANAWTGPLEWVPLPLQSLWHYHAEATNFHSGLSGDHPYISAPVEWPFLLRPTAFAYDYSDGSNPACPPNECVAAITSLSNPLMYWLGTVAIVFLVMYLFVKPNWRSGLLITAYGAGLLPWLLTGRTSVYHFYVIAWLPFMYLAAAFALQTIAGSPRDDRRQRQVVMTALAVFLAIVVIVSIWFMPVWTGIEIPKWYWNSTHWLPGWK